MDSRTHTHKNSVPFAVEFEERRNVLLIAFSGFENNLAIFEFTGITSGLSTINRIFLRDREQLWYHRGVPDAQGNIRALVSFLQPYTAHPCTRRTVMFGNSGGGYAALLFGHLLGADEVYAFVPKTFLNPVRRLAHLDTMPSKRRKFIEITLRGQRKYFDLKPILSASNHKTQFHIYYSADARVDRLHAERMRAVPGVVLHCYPSGAHDLVHHLKKSGELRGIVERAVEMPDS